MTAADRQRAAARRAMWISGLIGILGVLYFTTRGEPITGLVIGVLLGGGGYWEYKRRLRDLERADTGDSARDAFERREGRR